jgi:hypothetical protein
VAASAVPAKLSVTITTSGAQMAGLLPANEQTPGRPVPWSSLGLVVPAAVLLGLGSRQSKLRAIARIAVATVAAAMLLSLAACGGSSTSSGGTQPGTYKVMVTATSGSLQSSAPISVTIMQ